MIDTKQQSTPEPDRITMQVNMRALLDAEIALRQRTESQRNELAAALRGADEECQQGLNSDNPKHWEAALQDIMQGVRTALAKVSA